MTMKPLKKAPLGLLACSYLLLGSTQVYAQLGPNLGNSVQDAVQNAVERQVEQAQNAALERAAEQAQAAASNIALERAQAVQAEVVQNQALEQVQNQVERVQERATDQAQNQVERVQEQVAEQAQAQVERVQAQVERVNAQVDDAQNQIDKVQSQVQRIPERATERMQQRVPELPPNVAAQVGGDAAAEVARGAAGTVAAAVPDGAAADVPAPGEAPAAGPERRTVLAADGNPAFVEITLAPGIRAVEFEWIMVVTPEQRAQLADEAAELLNYLTDAEPFALTEGELLTFTVPPDLDANDAILDLVPDTLRDQIDRNHIYDTQDDDRNAAAQDGAELTLPMPAVCAEPVTLGIIDSGVDTAHPAFAASAAAIHQQSFVDTDLPQSAIHGTAVASLLVGRDDSEQSGIALHPLLPAATLYSAAVFHEQEDAGQGATLMRILTALDWLSQQENLHVINMSLAGPPNRLLARAVAAAAAKGTVIIAAAGNDGPYGPVRYPAAYDEAIGVTAVGRDAGIFRFANQGPHIDYAALGVDVPAALREGGFGRETGTSLAAPVVAAFLACALAQDVDVTRALAALDARVRDLGAPGSDPVYGRGLLHP